MKPPRGLSAPEAALWRRVAETVTPLDAARQLPALPPAAAVVPVARPARPPDKPSPSPARKHDGDLTRHGLDASWERKLAKAPLAPDLTIDLHGLTLDAAHARLGGALAQALAMRARLVLVIAGKPRPHDDHGHLDHGARGQRRGAIRAKLLDWLAASPHAGRIAAVRPAQPRHGGAGAVYVVLRRPSAPPAMRR